MDSPPLPSRGSPPSNATSGISVYVRIRPQTVAEKEKFHLPAIVAQGDREVCVRDTKSPFDTSRTYSFSRVFGPNSTQKAVYDHAVAPVISDVVSGYNCTVFAYGQTGTGKTYTMEGERSNPNVPWDDDPTGGMIPRAVHHLFDALQVAYQSDSSKPSSVALSVSYVELYNENIFDLLTPPDKNGSRNKLQLFDDPVNKGSVLLKGVTKKMCITKEEVIKLLEFGAASRKKTATLLNTRSSRSHAIFMITVFMNDEESDGRQNVRTGPKRHSKTGKLNLVDLAGSESIGRSGATDNAAREAGCINKSLLNLRIVINALASGGQLHIPYRGSKLTRLLQDSLGGRTKTTLIAAVSPISEHMEESVSTLDYACKAKSIVNHPEVSAKSWKKLSISDYLERIEQLRQDLSATQQEFGIYMKPDQYESWRSAFNEIVERYNAKKEELFSTREALVDVQQLFDSLNARRSELEAMAAEKEMAAREAESVGRCLELRHKLYKQKGEEVVNISKGVLKELGAVTEASTRMRQVNSANRAAYRNFFPLFAEAADDVAEVAGNFHLDTDYEKTVEDLLSRMDGLESAAVVSLKTGHGLADGGALAFPEGGPMAEFSEDDIDFGSPELENLGRLLTLRDSAFAEDVKAIGELNRRDNAAVCDSLRNADAELDVAAMIGSRVRMELEGSLSELSKKKKLDAGEIETDFASARQSVADGKEEVARALAAFRAAVAKLQEGLASATAASSKTAAFAQNHEKAHLDLLRTLEEAEVQEEVHRSKADVEVAGSQAVLAAMRTRVEQNWSDLKEAEKDDSAKFDAEVSAANGRADAAIEERIVAREVKQREVVNAFTCAELQRRMLEEGVKKNYSEAGQALGEMERTSAQFVAEVSAKWFDEAPNKVDDFFARAEADASAMASVFESLYKDGFVEYEGTGATPQRRPDGAGLRTPLRLSQSLSPLTPREAIIRRHREMIRMMENAALDSPVEEPPSPEGNDENQVPVEAAGATADVATPMETGRAPGGRAPPRSAASSSRNVGLRRNLRK